jgi:hypothetical protein
MLTTASPNQLAQLNPPVPQPPVAREGTAPPEAEAANIDSSLDVFSDPHSGQETLSSLRDTSSSNLAEQSLHLYSKIGITSYLHPAGT